MAVFVLVAALDGGDVARGRARGPFALLAPRAPHGSLELHAPSFSASLGHSFARERRDGQAAAQSATETVLLDGRLANAAELARELGVDAQHGDAAIVARAWQRWRNDAWPRLRGVFSLVLIEGNARALQLVRDPTGQRPLYWRSDGARAYVASEERVVLAAAQRALQADDTSVAAHFALRAAPPGRCFVDGVSEALPGECTRIDARGARRSALPSTLGTRLLRLGSDDEYAEAWHGVLVAALHESLRDARAPALSLSGGLDSGALAALAREAHAGTAPVALSWSLASQPASDERDWVERVADACGLELAMFAGDAHGPLARGDDVFVQPNSPGANAYRGLKHAQYTLARERGSDVLLSGNFGDHAYPDAGDWLAGALRSRRWRSLLREIVQRRRQGGFAAWWRDPGWRAPLRRVRARTDRGPDWLTLHAQSLLDPRPSWPPHASRSAQPRLCRALLGLAAVHDAADDTWFADRFGLEVRYPYRDPRVLDFVLSLPADVQHRAGVHKALTRRMLAGRLPERSRVREKAGSLLPFFRASVRGTARERVQALLFSRHARWARFADPARVRAAWVAAAPTEAHDLLLWTCLGHELWLRSMEGESPVLGSPT